MPVFTLQHQFREAETRPSSLVSTVFTGLVCLPMVALLGLWMCLGVNVSNMSLSISTVGFHAGLAGKLRRLDVDVQSGIPLSVFSKFLVLCVYLLQLSSCCITATSYNWICSPLAATWE